MDDISPFTRSTPMPPALKQELHKIPSFDLPAIQNQFTQAKPSAIIRRQHINRIRPWFERIIAGCMLSTGYASTIALCNGGWGIYNPGLVILACILQTFCTITQWLYRHQWRRSLWYQASITIDVVTTVGGLYALIYTPILDMTHNPAATWGIIIVIAIIIAIVPETILVD